MRLSVSSRRLSSSGLDMARLIKRIAIEKCDRRLGDATTAFAVCLKPNFYEDFVKGWTDFLIAATSIPHIIEKAAGATPQARQWYGGKRNEGRKDPLVLYMFQARNAEEHGIEPVTEFEPAEYTIEHPEMGMTIGDPRISPDGKTLYLKAGHGPTGPTPRITRKPANVRLASVYDDRFKQTFDPPTVHLGQPINSGEPATPAQAGNLYLSYVSALVRAAEILE